MALPAFVRQAEKPRVSANGAVPPRYGRAVARSNSPPQKVSLNLWMIPPMPLTAGCAMGACWAETGDRQECLSYLGDAEILESLPTRGGP